MLTGFFGGPAEMPDAPATDFHHAGVALEQKEKAPHTQKSAFILSRIEGMSNIEISSVLNKNVGAVESLISRAGENLKKNLSAYK